MIYKDFDFKLWMKKNYLSYRMVQDLLGLTRPTISIYRQGRVPICVYFACLYLDYNHNYLNPAREKRNNGISGPRKDLFTHAKKNPVGGKPNRVRV